MAHFASTLSCSVAALLALSLSANAAESGCASAKWSVSREEAAFAAGTLPVISSGGQLAGVANAATLSLAAQNGMSFAVPPIHKPKSKPAHAGEFLLPPTAAGSYQVTLSDDAWIDVVQDGKLLKQTGFTGMKDCPAVRKSVKFDLATGPATIMISDAGKDALKIDILPTAP